MFGLVGFSLSSKERDSRSSYKFDILGLTLSQVTLTEGTQVNLFVKFPEDEKYMNNDLSIATVTKSHPNACLSQLELPVGSVVYCTGSGAVFCVANKPVQTSCSKECCKGEICKIETEDEECHVNDICEKDECSKGNKRIRVSDSTTIPISSEMKNEKTKKRKAGSKDLIENSKEKSSNKTNSAEMISPGYKREFANGLKYEVMSISKNVRSDVPQIAVVGSKVNVKYEGRLAKTGKKFDSGTLTFTVGSGQVVPGFDQGVKGMIVTETRRVFIPSKLGYGIRGCPPVIPKNADLVFEITLLSTKY
ncbi:fkbp [Cryptosporidium ryanae]|uniref:fkbp n=1 Tax=Cryptosporidium ryanae TaxID=515981 RepID=UPI003519EBAF|nr:fkbp [Cryptosporidium ryanae]